MPELTKGELSFLRGVLLSDYSPGDEGEAEYQAELLKTLDAALEDEETLGAGDTLELWSDGATRPTNPGPSGIGVVGKVRGKLLLEVSEHIGRKSNNYAEYRAAITALKRAIDLGATRAVLHSDSRLVVEQFHGRWACREASLQPLLGRLRGLALRFDSCRIVWIPREQNREADGLSVAGAYPPQEKLETEE